MKPKYNTVMARLCRCYSLILVLMMVFALLPTSALATGDTGNYKGETMWESAERIIKDVYTKRAGVSTVLAGLMSAVAVVGAKMSNNQHKTDQAWDWLKRVWIAWAIINGIGAFLAYVIPLFNGLSTLDPLGTGK